MEQPLSSLTFKGSITEAILESKNQRKLFVVYISGDDAESSSLERFTWASSNVAEALSKYCILLHISAGSIDATQFLAIYPQKSVPCITAVGYNGIQLWQNEGFVSAEVLASNLEKAWLGLHIQETTASVLTAALASKNSEASTLRPSNSTLSDLGSSSSAAVSHAHHFKSLETNHGVNHEMVGEEKGPEQLVKEDTIAVDRESKVHHAVSVENDESPDSSEEDKSSMAAPIEQQNCSIEHASNTVHGSSLSPKLTESCQSGASGLISLEAKESSQEENNETINDNRTLKNDTSTKDYTSVHLNIRLLNGVNLQEKFSMTSTLRMVKDYVDNNQENTSGSYDLAIPYPRKVFTDHDLDKSLSDLGLYNRQALIVVRHQGVSSDYRGISCCDQRNYVADDVSSDENGDGYLAYIKRILSYLNPFSYLGGGVRSASSRQEIQGGMQQYSSNTTAQNDSSEVERPYTRHPSNQSTSMAGGNNTRSRQPSTSRFGANIHTLKHDEDDERFRGRNSFWNGNSTQYGGDNDGK